MGLNKRLISQEAAAAAVVVNTDNFTPFLYTGDNTTSRSLTGVGFDPDMIWVKNRDSDGENHVLADTVRGGGSIVFPNLDLAEITSTYITPATDGFNITTNNNNILDFDYVAWCFKAGGAAVTNNDYLFAAEISANPDAGFSIVKTQTGSSTGAVEVQYGEFKYAHGLNQTPELIITKITSTTGGWDTVYYPNGTGSTAYGLSLNTTGAAATYTLGTHIVGINSTYAHMWNYPNANVSPSQNVITYNFHSVDGYQKVGTYTGNGGTQSITLGFSPRFVMWKATNSVENWYMMDSVRGENNVLYADGNFAEGTSLGVSFNSNGFTLTGSFNGNGINYIYLAIA